MRRIDREHEERLVATAPAQLPLGTGTPKKDEGPHIKRRDAARARILAKDERIREMRRSGYRTPEIEAETGLSYAGQRYIHRRADVIRAIQSDVANANEEDEQSQTTNERQTS